MGFFNQLVDVTNDERAYLLSAPIIEKSLASELTLEEYVAFLIQAYHHVKHTVPLLMAVGARLDESYEWLRNAVAEYIEEELGHQEWILNDIEACGYDKEWVRNSEPNIETELMVAYAYDRVNRVNPLGFFGMVHVLEGTSVSVADTAASNLKAALNLPESAFSYLRSHGALDVNHIKFFENLMNKIDDVNDQACIIHSAKVIYRLYGDIFRGLDAKQARSALTIEK